MKIGECFYILPQTEQHFEFFDLLADFEQDRRLITTRVSTDDEFQDAACAIAQRRRRANTYGNARSFARSPRSTGTDRSSLCRSGDALFAPVALSHLAVVGGYASEPPIINARITKWPIISRREQHGRTYRPSCRPRT
ncbi:MAG: hypothetical protein ACI8TX_003760 [Hyphomicrobiaceae bacterium]|jgi:hypothetical protein